MESEVEKDRKGKWAQKLDSILSSPLPDSDKAKALESYQRLLQNELDVAALKKAFRSVCTKLNKLNKLNKLLEGK